jgi:hypothetical protein
MQPRDSSVTSVYFVLYAFLVDLIKVSFRSMRRLAPDAA